MIDFPETSFEYFNGYILPLDLGDLLDIETFRLSMVDIVVVALTSLLFLCPLFSAI